MCVPNVHKHIRSAQATETRACVPGRPAFTLILMPWGSRSYVRNLFKTHHTGTYSNPQHQAPNICSPLHWQPYQFQRKCLLAILEGKEKLCEADGQAVPTSFWLPYEDVPECSLKTEETGGFLCGYFSQIMKIDCFRSKTYRQEVALYLPTSGWEAENRAWSYLFWVESL